MKNPRRRSTVGILVAIVLTTFGLLQSAVAATVYVDTTTELENALGNAQPGDVISVAPGTYQLTATQTVGIRSVYFHAGANGTSSNPITLESADASNPAILMGGDIANAGYTLYITGDYWRVNDINVTHGQKGIVLDNSNHTHLNAVQVYHVGQEAIHVRDGSSNVIIENSYVTDTGATMDATDWGFAEGIYIGSDRSVWEVNEGTSGSNAAPGAGYDRKVYNTIVRNNITGSLVRAEPMDIKEGASGTLVEGNTFLGAGIVGDSYNYADSFIDVKSFNTTIRDNVGYRQNNSNIDMDIHEIDRTSSNPWCPSNETSNKSLSDTSDGNTYSNNVFHMGEPPSDFQEPVPGQPNPSTGDTQAPSAPSNLSATTASSSQIDLLWSASSDNVGVTGYDIYRGTSLLGSTSSTSYSDTGLAASTAYNYTVKAKDAAGNISTASNSAGATTDASGNTTSSELSVSSVTASASQSGNGPANTIDKDLSTRWSQDGLGEWIQYDLGSEKTIDLVKIAFYNGNLRNTYFDIQVSTDGSNFNNVLSGGTGSGSTLQLETFDFTDVAARYVRVVGQGNSTNTWNSYTEVEVFGAGADGGGSTGDTQAPTAPSNLTATTVSSSEIDLNWLASSDNVGVTSYDVYRGNSVIGSASGTSFTDTGLSSSTTYSYTVKAKDAANNVSAASNSDSATTSSGGATSSSLTVHYQDGDSGDVGDNDIRPYLKIVNNGSSPVALSELKIRYFYKKESTGSQIFSVDYAAIGKSNVTGTFGTPSSITSTADAYMEVGFTSGAGSLASGGDSGIIKTRMNNSDWTNFDETNDYSYNSNYTSLSEYDGVALYHNGTLIWGLEP